MLEGENKCVTVMGDTLGCYQTPPTGSKRTIYALRMVEGLANPPQPLPLFEADRRLSLTPRPEFRTKPSDRTPPASATYTFSVEAQSSLSMESASCCRRASSEPTSCPEREGSRLIPGQSSPSGGTGDPGPDQRLPRFRLQREGSHLPKEN